jgi:hypothetical protein
LRRNAASGTCDAERARSDSAGAQQGRSFAGQSLVFELHAAWPAPFVFFVFGPAAIRSLASGPGALVALALSGLQRHIALCRSCLLDATRVRPVNGPPRRRLELLHQLALMLLHRGRWLLRDTLEPRRRQRALRWRLSSLVGGLELLHQVVLTLLDHLLLLRRWGLLDMLRLRRRASVLGCLHRPCLLWLLLNSLLLLSWVSG